MYRKLNGFLTVERKTHYYIQFFKIFFEVTSYLYDKYIVRIVRTLIYGVELREFSRCRVYGELYNSTELPKTIETNRTRNI